MKTILVSGASGIVGYGVLRSLKSSDLNLRLIGTTIYENTAAEAFSDIFEKAPATNEETYIPWLIKTIEKYQVDMIVPGIEADLYKWNEHSEIIRSTGTAILLNNPELIRLCQDKWEFYQSLQQANTTCAIQSTLNNDFGWLKKNYGDTLLLKPRKGFASKGIVKVTDEKTFNIHRDMIGEILMVQPFIGTDQQEYTSTAFGDGQGGFSARMTMRRNLSREGFTEKAEVIWPDELSEIITGLCSHFKPIGPTNFQFRKHQGEFKLLEINPRISSSTSIRTAFGYNESAMSVNYYLNNVLPTQPAIRQGKAIRYTEDFIFPL